MQIHGGDIYGRENTYELLDFSANINPLGMPENIRQAVINTSAEWQRYPDPCCTELTKAIAEKEGLTPEKIVCGSGAAELIYRIAAALKPRSAVVLAPTFSEYAKAVREAGGCVLEYFLKEENDFALDEGILTELDKGAHMLFLCSPNNPTGALISPELLKEIARKCGQKGIYLICDECFMDFAENSKTCSLKAYLNERCIILKAFTKIYAMAGLRLGYALFGDKAAAQAVKGRGQYWPVSAPAQAAGLAALSEGEFVQTTVKYIKCEREYLYKELGKMGIRAYPSAANYILLKAEAGLDRALLSKGILIRSCESFSGLGSEYFRIAVRTRTENERLINAVRGLKNG